MKYEQPYGISDPNAPYINGNPSTGTMGSIPPAASIEFPQREIVNFISKSHLIPTDSDLFQLAKAVQSGAVNYGDDTGGVNDIQITPVVPIAMYAKGQRFIIKVRFGNTSQVTVNVNQLGQVPLIHCDQSPLNAYELVAGQLIDVAYDGANFEALGGVTGGAVIMTAPQTLYVNASTGSDTIYDGTSPVISGVMTGPFKTIQKALATMTKYNLGGWDFTISVADGVYTNTDAVSFPQPNGSGRVWLTGNTTNPNACSIFNTGTGSCFLLFSGGNYYIHGFSFRATAGNPGDQGHGIWVMFGTFMWIGRCVWLDVPWSHYCVGAGSTIFVGTEDIISGNAPGGHQNAYTNGICLGGIGLPSDPILTFTKSVTLGQGFAVCNTGAQIWSIWSAQNGTTFCHGPRYNVTSNGVLSSGGRGPSALPGDAAPIINTGGQYL